MKRSIVLLWGVLLFLPMITSAQLPSLQDNRDNGVYRASCNQENCIYNGTIYLQREEITGGLENGHVGGRYYTAKGPQGVILATNATLSCTSAGPVVLKGNGDVLPADVDFRAGKEIILGKEFTAERGCVFHAYIVPKWSPVSSITFTPGENLEDNWVMPDPDSRIYSKSTYQFPANAVVNAQGELQVSISDETPSDGLAGPRFHGVAMASRRHIHTANEPFGRYDIEAKMPTELGVHSAVWLLTHSGYDDAAIHGKNEFDIVEIVGGTSKNRVNAVYHDLTETPSPAISGGVIYKERDSNFDFGDQYHLYSLEWEEDEVRLLIDDCVVERLPNRYAGHGYHYPAHMDKQPVQWVIDIVCNVKDGQDINLVSSLFVKSLTHSDRVTP